jgi:class 3 adenylate cyclase
VGDADVAYQVIGDGQIDVVFGWAIKCALAIVRSTAELGLGVRAGLHSGECLVRSTELSGIAVHLAARVGAGANPQEVLVTSTVHDLVAGSDLAFINRGVHQLKGIPQPWQLYGAASDDAHTDAR